MYMMRTFTGSPRDVRDPAIRKIHFGDEPAIRTVAAWLQCAWCALPPANLTESDDLEDSRAFGEFCRKYQGDGGIRIEDIPMNPDTKTVNSAWRERVYFMYNHIFYDVMRWLAEAAGGVGHYHPPNHEVFALDFPSTSETSGAGVAAIGVGNCDRTDDACGEGQAGAGGDRQVTKMKWPTNVLLMPVYLGPGVNVRVIIADRPKQDGAEDEGPVPEDEEVGIFDGTDAMVVWYLRAAVEVQLVIETKVGGKGDGENEIKGEIDNETAGEDKAKGENTGDSNDEGERGVTRDGVAAVFVVGVLCTTQHPVLTKA